MVHFKVNHTSWQIRFLAIIYRDVIKLLIIQVAFLGFFLAIVFILIKSSYKTLPRLILNCIIFGRLHLFSLLSINPRVCLAVTKAEIGLNIEVCRLIRYENIRNNSKTEISLWNEILKQIVLDQVCWRTTYCLRNEMSVLNKRFGNIVGGVSKTMSNCQCFILEMFIFGTFPYQGSLCGPTSVLLLLRQGNDKYFPTLKHHFIPYTV